MSLADPVLYGYDGEDSPSSSLGEFGGNDDDDYALSLDMNYTNVDGPFMGNHSLNCSMCLNELCLSAEDYAIYKSWVGVDTYEMVLISINLIVFLTGVIGNSLVFIAVTTTKSMQSVTNIFIVNLALADVLVMLFCAPPSIIWDVTNTWIFGSLMCRIVIYIQDTSVSVSVLTLTFIAYDRYHAICRPLQFSSKKTKAAGVIAGIWGISCMIGIPNAVTLHLVSPFKDLPCRDEDVLFDLSTCRPSWNEEFDVTFIIMKAILLYSLPLSFMSVAYYYICKTLWRRNNIPGTQETPTEGHSGHINGSTSSSVNLLTRSATVRLSTNSNSTGGNPSMIAAPETRLHHCTNRTLDNQLKTRRKVAKMLIVVVVMFSLNMFPVHMLPIVNYFVDKNMTQDSEAHERVTQVLMAAGIVTHCMCYFNSAINPIIYYFMSAQFKAQYRRILSCRCTADSPSPKTNHRNLLHQQDGGSNGNPCRRAGSSRTEDLPSRHLRSRSCLSGPTRMMKGENSSNNAGGGNMYGSSTRRVLRHPNFGAELQIPRPNDNMC